MQGGRYLWFVLRTDRRDIFVKSTILYVLSTPFDSWTEHTSTADRAGDVGCRNESIIFQVISEIPCWGFVEGFHIVLVYGGQCSFLVDLLRRKGDGDSRIYYSSNARWYCVVNLFWAHFTNTDVRLITGQCPINSYPPRCISVAGKTLEFEPL